MRVSVFGLILAAAITGCVGPLIPISAPDPYPESLAAYLSQPGVDRAGVQRWLGAPAATRMGGRYEMYVALREQGRDPGFGSTADYHCLLVEYDAHDGVAGHQEFVSGWCPSDSLDADSLCVAAPFWQGQFLRDLAEETASVIDQLALYATPEMDRQAKDSATSREGCRRFVYRSLNGFRVKLIEPENNQSVSLPPDGYLVLTDLREEQQMRVAWSDRKGNYEEQSIEVGCTAPGVAVTWLELQSVKRWGTTVSLTARDQPVDEGMAEIGTRRLVLQ